MRLGLILTVIAFSPAACVPPAPTRAASGQPSSILQSSRPAAGSAVVGPVDELVLHFDPPARLDEVTVTGHEGTMPMMVHAVGESADYSLPLSGVESGSYRVDWRATVRGREYRGSFEFSVPS
jgi:methionine-rich copper-binding protein CopC